MQAVEAWMNGGKYGEYYRAWSTREYPSDYLNVTNLSMGLVGSEVRSLRLTHLYSVLQDRRYEGE